MQKKNIIINSLEPIYNIVDYDEEIKDKIIEVINS